MNAIKRLGVLYGKLGLATDTRLIEVRQTGVKAAADELQAEGIPDILRCAFGLKSTNANFLTHFSETDPTFDVQPGDREAALLAGSVVAYEMEQSTSLSGELALSLVTASFGGIRSPVIDDELVALGEKTLAEHQSKTSSSPADRKYSKQPETLTSATQNLVQFSATPHYHQVHPHVSAVIQELGKYAEANALAAAKNDNEILHYVRMLEEEVRVYWWVTGGWSTEAKMAFHSLKPVEAALRAGKELAEKHSNPIGLFAAPALLGLVLERGRQTASKGVSLAKAAVIPDRTWRAAMFESVASGPLADLLPMTAALGLAVSSDDADDWQPRFKRLTNVDPMHELEPQDLGLQLYREQLMLRALAE